MHAGLAPEGEVLVTFRAPFCVRDDCPAELSFDEWQPTDPLPEFNDDITGFGLGSPSGNLVDEPEDHPLRPVHFPDHPAFGPVSYVGVPFPVSPLGAESGVSTTDSAVATQLEGCVPDGDSLLEQIDPGIMDEFDLEPDISAEDFPTVDQSEANGVLEDGIFPSQFMEIAQSQASLLQIDEEPFALNDGVGQSESLSGSDLRQKLDGVHELGTTVGTLKTDSFESNLSIRDPENKRWFYEPRIAGSQPDLLAPAPTLPKRRSDPPPAFDCFSIGTHCSPWDLGLLGLAI